jgi:hypothetical protein
LELHGRLKAVDIQAQGSVQLGELSIRQFTDKAIIANHLPHNVVVVVSVKQVSADASGDNDHYNND